MIRKIASSGEVSSWARIDSKGTSNGRGYAVSFTEPDGTAVVAGRNICSG